MRDDPVDKGYTSFALASADSQGGSGASIFHDLWKLLHYKNTWILTIVPASLIGPVLAFAGLWGIPYLTTHYGLTTVKSASLLTTLLIACACGAPILGILSERVGRRKPVYFCALAISLLGWIPICYLPAIPLWLLVALFGLL